MKLMIASDVHGSAKWCAAMTDFYRVSGADRLLLLGDLLYHGPRNDLPEDYAPKRVIDMLSALRERVLCVRGNCEAEVDQMVLPFPVLADYCAIPHGDGIIYATHGHVWNDRNPLPLVRGDVLLCGHTHIPAFETKDGYTYINPGSVAIPKANSPHSCILLDGDVWRWHDLSDGHIFRTETC